MMPVPFMPGPDSCMWVHSVFSVLDVSLWILSDLTSRCDLIHLIRPRLASCPMKPLLDILYYITRHAQFLFMDYSALLTRKPAGLSKALLSYKNPYTSGTQKTCASHVPAFWLHSYWFIQLWSSHTMLRFVSVGAPDGIYEDVCLFCACISPRAPALCVGSGLFFHERSPGAGQRGRCVP